MIQPWWLVGMRSSSARDGLWKFGRREALLSLHWSSLDFGFPVLFLCFMSSSVNAGRRRFCFCMLAVRTLIRFLFYVELGHVKLPHIWLERHRRSNQQII